MDSESSRSFGDVLVAIRKNPVDMLPFGLSQSWDRDFLIRLHGFDLGAPSTECREDIVGIGRFWEKINRSKPNGVYGGCDAPKAGKNQDLDVGVDGF
jgi:hypothetical protein